jgi:hypothetical protein
MTIFVLDYIFDSMQNSGASGSSTKKRKVCYYKTVLDRVVAEWLV